MDSNPEPKRWSLGFGLERIGYVAHRHPRIATVIVALITAVSIYGLFHVKIDRDLRDMFQGSSPAYQVYLDAANEFVDPENQIIVLIEGETMSDPAVFAKLADLQIELQLLPDAGNVYSMFSLLGPPDADGNMAPIIPDAAGTALTPDLIAAIRTHPIAGDSLVSADGTAAAFSITHIEPRASLDDHVRLVNEINTLLPEVLDGTGLHSTVTGLATIRTEVVRILKRDQFVLNGSGILVGFILSFIFFRSIVASLMTAVPAALAGLMLIGWNATLGVPVTIVTNVVPILVMVLGYADGMHLTAAWRRQRDLGRSPVDSEWHALLDAAAPCMLTALTMALAFLSMTISDVKIIRDFGWTGAVGVILATWMVLVCHALMGRYFGRFWREGKHTSRTPLAWLAKPIVKLTSGVVKFAWPLSIISIPLTVLFGALYLSVPPDHSVRETLPSNSPAVTALDTIDAKLGGAFPVQIIVPLDGLDPTSPEAIARVRGVDEAVAAVDGTRSTLSLWSLARWLGGGEEGADADPARVSELLQELPDASRSRFLGPPGALVTANISELTTAETLDLVGRIETAAKAVDPDVVVTGATVVTAREATRTINNLNNSLGIAIFAALALIAIALRSVVIAFVALIPNLLPDMATGSVIYFLGDGMQLTGVLALTVAFGIAIDDTIHYVNVVFRHRHIPNVRDRLMAAAREVGPVLVATTLVIVCGVCMTLTSGLTTVALFGLIVITALVMAVFGDLIFLPAVMAGPAKRWFSRSDRVSLEGDPGEPLPAIEPVAKAPD